MSFADDILSSLDDIRGIAGDLGLRPFVVTLRTRRWTGPSSGKGVPTEMLTRLVNGCGQPVRVRQMSTKDIVASGGLYTDKDLRVGPMTPAYASSLSMPAGGFTPEQLDPPVPSAVISIDMQFIVTGPGIPSCGVIYDKIGQESTSLHYVLILRATGRKP